MDAVEHHRVLEEERAGRLLIGIDRPAARQFFTDTSHEAIRTRIGEPVFFERLLVRGAFISGYLLAAIAGGLSIWAFGWWSLLVAPVAMVCWFGYLAGSSRGNARLGLSLFLLAGAGGSFLLSDLSLPTKLFLVTLAEAFFLARFTYTSAVSCLRALVVRNWRAFDALEGAAVVVRRTQ